MGAIKKLVFAGGLVLLSSLSMAAPVAVDPGSTFVLKMVKPIELNASVGSVTSAPTTCSSRTIMWSGSASCSASVPAMSNGSTRTINDTTGKIGSATVSCNAASNAITVSGGSSCTDPVAVGNRPCSAQAVSWGACTASAPARNHGQNSSISDSTAPSTGSATFTCNDSSYVYSSGNCSTAATTCTNKTVNWSVGGNACGALSGVTNDGANKTVSNTASNGNTGNATFTCTAASDTYSLVGSPTCAPPPATACTSQTLGWTVGGTSCASNSGSVNNGVTTTLASTNGNSGSAQFTCNASTNTFSQTGTPTCAVPPPSSCSSQSKTWGTAPSDCSALTGTTNNGASRTISNTASNGNSGSATYVCNAGTNTYTVSGTPTCSQPAPTACTSQTKSWGTAPANCSAVTGATNNSVSKTVANTLNANSGSATYVCNAATDTYTVSGTPTCSQPTPTSCTSQTKSWSAGGNSCSGSTGATNNSVSKTVANTLNANTGSATYTCNAATDTYTVSGTPTCAAPSPTACTSQTKSWVSGSAVCSATTGVSAQGESKVLTSSSWDTGSATFVCNAATDTYTQSSGSSCSVSPIVDMALSGSASCALNDRGGVKCWGANDYGQLGDGTTTSRASKALVIGLGSGVTKVSGGGRHFCALMSNGGVKCWGENTSGQIGDGTLVNRLLPTNVAGLESGVVDISSGRDSSCALTGSGIVKCWGKNEFGGLGDGTSNNRSSPASVVGLGSGVKKIYAGGEHSCAVLSTDGVKCWGANDRGQLGDDTSLYSNSPVDVFGLSSGVRDFGGTSGGESTCVNMLAGGVKCWGRNSVGELGDGGNYTALDNNFKRKPVDVVGLGSGIKFLSGGRISACAVISSGGVRCWGDDYYGARGTGNNAGPSSTPTNVVGLTSGFKLVRSGGGFNCGLLDAGTARCWGSNNFGQLGDGTTVDRYSPVIVTP